MTVLQWLLANVFDHPSAAGSAVIAAKTAVVYLFLIIGLRLLGKRELGQMSLYDLVMIIILGNAVQNAMINNDNTLVGGVIASAVLLLMNRLFNVAVLRSKRLGHVMVGEPVLIVHDGIELKDKMRREGVTDEQLKAALREHQIENVSDARSCVLEVDGTISVVPSGSTVYRSRRHYRGLRLP